ncbi:type I methionyl aminopeptidase [Paludibaculum fermentans]|uniref:type I methionyl aminopeptidase n=1 Tax=Paludibaculum fermentans TaxID=1473598 RepID=UPI003EBC2775
MSIRSQAELDQLRAIGRIVRMALDEMAKAVRPGITTAELDAICAAVLARNGAEASPRKVYGFPGTACISVNDEAIHGIPGRRTLAEGDLVKLDVTAEKDGFVADAAVTVPVGRVSATAEALARCAESAFQQALSVARAGYRIYEIGRTVERTVRKCGFSVMKEFCGHGVGRTIHEEPCVPNYYDKRSGSRLTHGLVITIEPIISAGDGSMRMDADGWTVRTRDRRLAAHYEHSLVVTDGAPILLTVA